MIKGKTRQVAEWIIVFIVAIIVWFFVISAQNPMLEKAITVPLKYKNIGDGLTVVNPHDELRITLRLPRDRVSDLRTSNFEAVLDLKGLHEGNHNVRPVLSTPDKIEVIDDGGEQVIRLEPTVEKQLALEIRKIVDNSRPYLVKEIVKPEYITVSGAKDDVLTAAKAVVDIALDNITATTTLEVAPKLYTAAGDSASEELRASPAKVAVLVKMYTEKTVKLVAEVKGLRPSDKITVVPSEIRVYGDSSHISTLNNIEVRPADIRQLLDRGKADSLPLLPDGVFISPGQGKIECILTKGD